MYLLPKSDFNSRFLGELVMRKRNVVVALFIVLLAIVATVVIVRIRSDKDAPTSEEMILRLDEALGDEYKKQSMTEVAATLVYGNGEEDHNINYHVLKTTYYEANPADVTGLNVDALGVLFNTEHASCEEMKIQDWDAALYKTSKLAYLCWTYSPEVSYVLEYNPDAIDDEEIIKMAQSAKMVED